MHPTPQPRLPPQQCSVAHGDSRRRVVPSTHSVAHPTPHTPHWGPHTPHTHANARHNTHRCTCCNGEYNAAHSEEATCRGTKGGAGDIATISPGRGAPTRGNLPLLLPAMPGLQSALATSHETEGYSPNRHYKGTVQLSMQQDEQRVRTEDELGATGQLSTAR